MRNVLLILILFASLCIPALSTAQVVLKTDSLEVSCTSTDTIQVPVRVLNFTDVGSVQFTLSWNPLHLDYISTGALDPLFSAGAVNVGFDTVSFINQGKLTFNWTKFGGGTVPDSTILFSVAFVRIGGPYTPVALVNTPVSVEVTDPDGNEIPWMVMNGGVNPLDNKPPFLICPASVTVSAPGPTPVADIALDSLSDNCGTPAAGFQVTGATVFSAPNAPDASGTTFNFGNSTVTYTATDVGGNANTCSFTVTVEPTATDDLTLIAGNVSGSCNQTLSIPITTLNFDSLGSLQFSVGWNPLILDYQSVSNFNPALLLSPGNFGTSQIGAGFLAFNWTTSAPLTGGASLPDGAVLFTIDFTVLGADGDNSLIQFGDFPAVREAILAENLQEIPFVTIDGQANIEDNAAPALICPLNVAVPADPGQTFATVGNLAPLALNDNCPGVVQLAYGQSDATTGSGPGAANGLYNAGTTTVTYTATDVAGNTATCTFNVTVDAGETLNLFLDSLTVDCQGAGDTVSFDVTVENFTDVWGLQFSVAWDETVLSFVSVTNFYPGLGLDASSFLGFVTTPSGLLRFLDGDGTNGWPPIPDGDILFTINFVVLNANATTNLDFIPPFDAVDGTFNSIPLATTPGFFQSADQSPPTVVCPPPQTADAPLGQCSAAVILPAPTVSDLCGAIADTTQTPPGNTFNAGTNLVFYTATDDAGNSATCSFTVTVSEITPPQFTTCPPNDTVSAAGPNCQGTATWDAPLATDNCSVATVLPPNFPPGSSFPLGNTTITYLAGDQSNNVASCNFTITVVDNEAPAVTCPADLTVSATAGTGACEGIAVFDDPVVSDHCDQQIDLTGDWISGDTFPVGTTVVTFEAEDNFANTATCQFSVTVLDSVGPSLACPPSTVDSSDANACGANVFWDTPSALDDCDQNIVPIPDTLLQSGDFFAVGVTVITYTATDASGNSNTCSFSITILETVPPEFYDCFTAPILIELPSADCDTVVSWTPPIVNDNCALDTVLVFPPPGSNFVAGITPVTYTAVDESGNTSTCAFEVIVLDKVPPVLGACPPNDTVQVSGSCGIVYPWQLPSVSDNCDPNPIITAVPAPGDTLQIGTNTLNVYAEDASGNRDTCAFVVVVQGSSNPSWNIPNDIVLTTDSCSLPVAWPPVNFTGYCDTVFIDSTHASGDLFPVGTTTVFYTFTDINGGSIIDSFSVTIHELVPPSIVCPTGVIANAGGIVLADPGEIIQDFDTIATCDGIRLFFNTPIGVDNCTTGSTTVEPLGLTSGDAFPVGLNTVTYIATDASGNTAACSFSIEVFALEMFVEVMPIVACEPGQFDTLTAEAIGGATYFWTGPDGQQIADSDNQVIVVSGGGTSGLYTVYAELNGCLTPVDSALVIVAPDIVAQNDTFILSPGSLDTLHVLSNDIFVPTDGEICDYFPDNNDLALLPDGTFTYGMGEEPFTFTYMLCSKTCPNLVSEATVTIQLVVAGCEFIPNVFTPNQDGDHDYFVIPCLEGGAQREQGSLVVYNQWGDKVFEAEPYLNNWDGTLEGEPGKDLPDGTYFYIFKPRPNDPPQKGFVEIFR